MNRELEAIQQQIDYYKLNSGGASVGVLKDGYHSFNDLYRHRTLLLALACMNVPYAWKSRLHEDGTMYEGMFIVGLPTPTGMITYHQDIEYWPLFKIPELPHAPKFDGYTPEDVTNRIEDFLKSATTRLVNRDNIETIEQIVTDEILPVFGDDLVAQAAYIGFYNA